MQRGAIAQDDAWSKLQTLSMVTVQAPFLIGLQMSYFVSHTVNVICGNKIELLLGMLPSCYGYRYIYPLIEFKFAILLLHWLYVQSR